MAGVDRPQRLRRFWTKHRECAELRACLWRGGGHVSIKAKCRPTCDDRTVLTVNDGDTPVWLFDDNGSVVGRASELWMVAPQDRYAVVIGGATSDEARALWSAGDVCLVAPVEWM